MFESLSLLDYTVRNVALGSAILGFVGGGLGSFALLRRQSLLGDAVSHAALPGIVLAFLVTGSKEPWVLLLGAAIVGWLGSFLILGMMRSARMHSDSAQGIVLSVFFGFGLVLLTHSQKSPNASQAGLEKFLFGQAAALMSSDILFMTVIGSISFFVVLLFWKEFKLLSFDPGFSAVQGVPVRLLEMVLNGILVLAIVIGLQSVGVVLMSAMLVAPAAAARQWSRTLGQMVWLSSFFGALSGVAGAMLSSSLRNLPTGPAIVLFLAVVLLFSLLAAPQRGMVARFVRRRHNKSRFAVDAILLDLYELSLHHDDYRYGHSLSTLEVIRGREEGVIRGLEVLEEQGYAARDSKGLWLLTLQGYEQAQKMQREQ